MQNKDVRRVIVVSKTHLDVGYTDYAQNVLNRYVDSFIPGAVELAFAVNTPEQKRFVWTTGSYLIYYYLSHAGEQAAARLREALRLGYVRYHALPLTTHTELLSTELLGYALSIGKRLDAEFGQSTIAAKMTDVPGHTIALVSALADNGVTYLHIGVNGSSRVPQVPALFRWKNGEDEIAVSYAGAYGDAAVLESGVALEFLHTMDNSGPPKREDVDAFFANLAEKYPNANIEAGSLDDFARELPAVWESLPVVTEEIGDSWIHGVSSDPLKTARYRRLLALVDRWLESSELSRGSAVYEAVMEHLLLVAEHTWGMDTKKHLLDFTNWTKADFSRARAADRTDYSFFGERNRQIFEAVREELREYRGEDEVSSYSHFTRSHLEQRAYVDAALNALPAPLRAEADASLAFSFPKQSGTACAFERPISVGGWNAVIGRSAAITSVQNSALGIDRRVNIGAFCYESFGGKEAEDCFFDYARDVKFNYAWAACDFGKPGLRYETSIQHGLWEACADEIRQTRDTLTVFLHGEEEAVSAYGCPRELAITYRFLPDAIELTLYWRGKDAVRSPEALWLGFDLAANNPNRWIMQKLNNPVSPLNVVSGGNRRLHAVERLFCRTALEELEIVPLDVPLVSVGGRYLYDTADEAGDLRNGFWFLLCNNRWGTNFPQWFEDDMRCAFTVSLKELPPAVR
ncbi:MAG TPA: DUF5054 domain-containing protein [Feifaniaceae bacterium]|nr:DUF5054 domain-containing protein [Feifaniaceae bacterium]